MTKYGCVKFIPKEKSNSLKARQACLLSHAEVLSTENQDPNMYKELFTLLGNKGITSTIIYQLNISFSGVAQKQNVITGVHKKVGDNFYSDDTSPKGRMVLPTDSPYWKPGVIFNDDDRYVKATLNGQGNYELDLFASEAGYFFCREFQGR